MNLYLFACVVQTVFHVTVKGRLSDSIQVIIQRFHNEELVQVDGGGLPAVVDDGHVDSALSDVIL